MYIIILTYKENVPQEKFYYKNYADALTHFELAKKKNYDLIMLLNESEIITTNKKGDDF